MQKTIYPKIERPNKEELKRLFPSNCSQCSPCIKDCETCDGDKAKAEKWKCPGFASGFTILHV